MFCNERLVLYFLRLIADLRSVDDVEAVFKVVRYYELIWRILEDLGNQSFFEVVLTLVKHKLVSAIQDSKKEPFFASECDLVWSGGQPNFIYIPSVLSHRCFNISQLLPIKSDEVKVSSCLAHAEEIITHGHDREDRVLCLLSVDLDKVRQRKHIESVYVRANEKYVVVNQAGAHLFLIDFKLLY